MAQIQNDPSALAPVENICGRATGTKYAFLADCQRTPCADRANAVATKGRGIHQTPRPFSVPGFSSAGGGKAPDAHAFIRYQSSGSDEVPQE